MKPVISTSGQWFKDEHGRVLLLRGVNLGGSSKVPSSPNGATHLRAGFLDHRNVSFIGRPFPLSEADEHLARLRRWGFDFLRLLVTWEAIEHAGPGLYDEAYLDYIRALVQKAGEHGFNLFIDPHQDVWSRFSGGDGAPGWTLEAVGFDLAHLDSCGAAIVHQMRGDPFPRMIWPTNGAKLASATMFTLFFGGNDFAPTTRIEGEPAQDYLQRHYIGAVRQLALRLADFPHVVGYDTLNEPSAGWIGWQDITAAGGEVMAGNCPSPFQSMLLGSGIPQRVDRWEMTLLGPRRRGTETVNPQRERAWQDGHDCVWRENGVWSMDARGRPQLQRPEHFAVVEGRRVDFARDYYVPFANRFARSIRTAHRDALIFIESDPVNPLLRWGPGDASGIVYAPHWYDGLVLYTKHFSPILGADMFTGRVVVGPGTIRRSFQGQLGRLRRTAVESLGLVPTLIGEFGVPHDLDGRRAYRTGDFRAQVRAMDRTWRALEANMLSGTLWNYTADNSNERGDQWNGEDFSIFSRDQQQDPTDPDSGGRALEGAVRPYPRAVAGEPLSLSFDLRRREFRFTFRHDPGVEAPTMIFLPRLQYPNGFRIEVSDGAWEVDASGQQLAYRHDPARTEHTLRIRPR
jgi:hypothetical protein